MLTDSEKCTNLEGSRAIGDGALVSERQPLSIVDSCRDNSVTKL